MRGAAASFHRTGPVGTDPGKNRIERAIDGQLSTYWDAWPEVYGRQEAVFELQPNPDEVAASTLVVQLTSIGVRNGPSSLGCFRLSVTSDPAAFDGEQHASLQ